VSAFKLVLLDYAGSSVVEGVSSFVGEDASGSFGILAGHARFMTVLVLGLARFRVGDEPWRYLAMPGATLYFLDDVLTLTTRRYLVDTDYSRISEALQQQLLAEERNLRQLRESLRLMEEQMLKRLWDLSRGRES
jgi:F-type H+-transporting ATPase subunit epsilon